MCTKTYCYAHVYSCMCAYSNTCIDVHTQILAGIDTLAYRYTHADQTHTNRCVHTHTYTHMDTPTQECTLSPRVLHPGCLWCSLGSKFLFCFVLTLLCVQTSHLRSKDVFGWCLFPWDLRIGSLQDAQLDRWASDSQRCGLM